jgi:hypothetical protein
VDHEALLVHYGFQRLRRLGDEIRATCVFCGKPQKFWLNLRKNLCVCFRGCFAGPIEALVARLENVDLEAAARMVGERTDWHSSMMARLAPPVETDRRRVPFVLPPLAPLNTHAVDYFRGRCISPMMLERYGAGACTDAVAMGEAFWDCPREDAEGILTLWPARGAGLLARAVFPVLKDGVAVCAEARALMAGMKPKTLYPQGVDQKLTLFGLAQAVGSDYVVIVEGLPDLFTVAAWGFPVVATLSAGVSPEQAAEVLRHFGRVYFAYDNDKGGRAGLRYSLRTLDDGVAVYVMELPDGMDPNDMAQRLGAQARRTFAAAFCEARRLPVGYRLDKEGRLEPRRRKGDRPPVPGKPGGAGAPRKGGGRERGSEQGRGTWGR